MAGGPNPGSAGFNPHLPPGRYNLMGKFLGASLWFFIFYRARQDGAKLLGHHPWDSHGAHGPKSEHGGTPM